MVKASARPGSGLGLIKQRIEQGWKPPIARFIGFELTKAQRGSAVIEMDVGPQHANPMGTLHGGIMCDIADAAMGISYVTTLGKGESFTTMELKVNFLRPVWTGHLIARGKVIKKGRTTGLISCRVEDEQGKLVAYATSTCLTISSEEAQGLTRSRSYGKR